MYPLYYLVLWVIYVYAGDDDNSWYKYVGLNI